MGYLRFFFAVTVTINHLWWTKVEGYGLGYGFYCISGFWITRIIFENYGSSLHGKLHFLINRFIRIYPPYYLCLGISLTCLALQPDAHILNPVLTMPKTWLEWLPQIGIFGLNEFGVDLYRVRLLPTAWSLNTELFYYVLMCLVIGTSIARTLIWFFASLALSIYLVWSGYTFKYHYFTLYAPSLCFAAGAMLYHIRPRLSHIPMMGKWAAIIAGNAWPYLPSIFHFGDNQHVYFLYASIPFYLYIIACLDRPEPVSRTEQVFTDMSYLLFILHWPVAALFMHMLTPHTMAFWAAATSLSTLLSFMVVKITSFIFIPIRKRVREKAKRLKTLKTA